MTASSIPLRRGSRVLVTGGSGFIGTNLVEALRATAIVKNLDLQPPQDPAHGPLWSGVDLRDRPATTYAVREFAPDVVLHVAARTDLRGTTLSDYDSNTEGTASLLAALDTAGFRGVAVMFSSMLVNRPGLASSELGVGEPDTPYGESKRLMEEALRRAMPGYSTVVVRPTSIWGPWFGEPYRNFFSMVLRERYVHPGTRAARKTFGYVGNLVHQTLALAERPVAGIPFYLGDDPPVDISEWANEIASLAGVARPPRAPFAMLKAAALVGDGCARLGVPFPLSSRRLRNMTQDNVFDLAAIRAQVPESPFSRAAGTRTTIDWLRRIPTVR